MKKSNCSHTLRNDAKEKRYKFQCKILIKWLHAIWGFKKM